MSKKKSDIDVHKGAPAEGREGWPPLASLRQEIDRLFDDFGGGLWHRPLAHRMQALMPGAGGWPPHPAMELVECDGEYRITAELPGMSAENIEIKLTDGSIAIRGEKSEEKKEEKEDYLLNERRYGAFHRSLPLPAGIDAEGVAARFDKGVLTVTLPKSAAAKEKERKVQIEPAA
jgi:HSP20 family protein